MPIGDWTFSNWPLYIDKKVLKTFDKRYGGHVKYIEEINDNDEFYGKVRQQLQDDEPIGRDIVTLTDYMAAKWVRNGYLTPMDKHNIPNVVRNLSPTCATRRTTRSASSPCRGSPAPTGIGLQHQAHRAASCTRSRTCSTRRSRAG